MMNAWPASERRVVGEPLASHLAGTASPERVAILKEEYFHLQDMVETFDQRALQIKGWSVTISLAGMAATLIAKGIDPHAQALGFALSAIASLAFWMIEFSWKEFQRAFYVRIDEIERAFAAQDYALAPLQIRRSFRLALMRFGWANLTRAFLPFICLPHVAVAIVGFILAAYYWPLP